MKKIIVIGCPGSGKSTFSRALSEKVNIPVYHLDMMNWNEDKTTVEREVFIERLQDVLKKDEWIIDGNYASTMEIRMKECDSVFFLDYLLEVCLDGVMSRRGKPRADMPWIEGENEIDEEFIAFIKNYNLKSRGDVLSLFEKYKHKNMFIFKSREEADDFLKNKI